MAGAVTLKHAPRGPLTWWLHEGRDVLSVVCSSGHRSVCQHWVDSNGKIYPPDSKSPSMHCGTCNEDLPLRLADWSNGDYRGPRPEQLPPESTCARCGKKERFLGGWGRCGGYPDIVCRDCFREVVKPNV